MNPLLGLMVTLCLVLIACDAQPKPVEEVHRYAYPSVAHTPPSIDQQIFDADLIVVAILTSASAGVETIPGDAGVTSTYLPKQIISFRAVEYLKGTGPTTLTVEVMDDGPVYTEGDLYEGYLLRRMPSKPPQKSWPNATPLGTIILGSSSYKGPSLPAMCPGCPLLGCTALPMPISRLIRTLTTQLTP